ncbi:DUF1330 domain-containing protein [Hyphomonas sp.]|jgi:uncharacterized protein (DUF1330 family)|uniref:DUF1330 domain-containing protein n=1 Tax=Hyphomonas sp. TaxID=87 RepID=UPI000C63EDD8|nr:DUF1330 domain-containing protein [Hyphomonas sp.]MAB11409.1 DUF1330 domain-containing protein [Hyphomonas sp.]MAU67079.1 DUF1330 domain-containing protein [Hyphomonas sp.]MBM57175.1 DUF1330 domain-containing protein [Hyphomonas sp.]
MEVRNEVFPSDPARMQQMLEKGPDGPIFMVNLLKFKDKAEYDDGRKTDLSGRDAYMIYGRAVADILPKFGGRAVFAADVTFLALGDVEELWDEVAIAMYPSRADMVRMSLSEEWREAAVHRSAGLKGQLNIETVLPAAQQDSPWVKSLLGD